VTHRVCGDIVAAPGNVRGAKSELGDTWCIKCQTSGHTVQDCKNHGTSAATSKPVPSCFKCHQAGHWAFSCPSDKPTLKRKFASFKLYDTLGIEQQASEQDIRRAYRKLAVQYHPDKGGDSEKFLQLHDAYEIVGNAEKRSKYDQFGDDGIDALLNVAFQQFCKGFGFAGKGDACFYCRQPGHWARECPDLQAHGFGTSSVGMCFKCQKPGHWARDCPGSGAGTGTDATGMGRASDNGQSPDAGGTRIGTCCFKCRKSGHWARECPGLRADSDAADVHKSDLISGLPFDTDSDADSDAADVRKTAVPECHGGG